MTPTLAEKLRRRDHRRPLPAGHPDVPQLGQEAARRAGQLLPAAHRGQHGVHRALHQLGAAAVQARRRSCVAAHQHSRARRADQEHREPELGRHPDHEAARGLVLLRQPARCPPGCGCGVPARAPPRHLPLPGHQARERRREDPHQDAVPRRGDPGHHLRAGQEQRGHVPVLAVRRRARLRRAVRRHLGHREVLRDGRRRADPQDQDQGARVLPDAGRAAVRVGLPVHHVRGHGEPGQPDRGQDHPLATCARRSCRCPRRRSSTRTCRTPRWARTSRATSAR